MTGKFGQLKLWLLIVFSLHSVKTSATHAFGAELGYEYISNNQYRITFTFYRECSGLPAPNTIDLIVTSSCYISDTVLLTQNPGTPEVVSTVCSSVATTCSGGIYLGIQKWEYSGIANLNGPCYDWNFSASVCCRSSSITTVDSVANDNIFVYSMLNNEDFNSNNSPKFSDLVYPSGCLGQQFCINNSALDIDGDSLSYSLTTPLSAYNSMIRYRAPNTHELPIVSIPGPQFNSITGEFCLYPNNYDISVYAILVSEYRNGILIGQTEKDLQFQISNCLNKIPSLSGINGTSSFNTSICVGSIQNLSIYSADPDIQQTTSLSWNNGIPGATFVNFGGDRDSANFSWTPTSADIRPAPHCFIVSVKDDNCPYIGSANYNYCFTVVPSSNLICGGVSVKENLVEPTVEIATVDLNNEFRLSWNESSAFLTLKIYDSTGKEVLKTTTNSMSEKTISLESLSNGIYIVCLEGRDHWCKRIVR